MYYLKIRIHLDNLTDDQIRSYNELISKYFIVYIESREKPAVGREHAHFYVETDYKPSQIRSFIKYNIGSGNGRYSVGELDEEKPLQYIAYILKYNRDLKNVYYEGIDVGLLQKGIEHGINEEEQNKKKKKERKGRTVYSDIESYINSTVLAESKDDFVIDIHRVVSLVMAWHKEKKKVINERRIEDYARTYLVNHYPTYEYKIIDRVTRNLKEY